MSSYFSKYSCLVSFEKVFSLAIHLKEYGSLFQAFRISGIGKIGLTRLAVAGIEKLPSSVLRCLDSDQICI